MVTRTVQPGSIRATQRLLCLVGRAELAPSRVKGEGKPATHVPLVY